MPSIEGICLVKSTYIFLTKHLPELSINRSWNWIWSLQLIPKIKMFIWRCAHDCLPMRKIIFAHGEPNLRGCPRCRNMESTIHVLRDCIWAQHIWENYLFPLLKNFQSEVWLKENSILKEVFPPFLLHGGSYLFMQFGLFGYREISSYFKIRFGLSTKRFLVFTIRLMSLSSYVIISHKKKKEKIYIYTSSSYILACPSCPHHKIKHGW